MADNKEAIAKGELGQRSQPAGVVERVASVMADRKSSAAAKRDFELHVALIMRQEGIAKARANMIAWFEGEAGLSERLKA